MGEIVAEDTPEKCLLESRKVELKIEQRKLLGIKAAISYDSVQTNSFRGRAKFRSKSRGCGISSSSIRNCKYCGKTHNKGNCPAFGKKCGKCRKDNHFKVICANLAHLITREIAANIDQEAKGSKKKIHEVNEEEGVMG